MEAAKIGPDLRLPIIILVCPPEILHNFFKFSWVEIEDNAYAKFRGGQTRFIMGDVQLGINNFLWNMAFLMENGIENDKQIIVVLSFFTISQKQENTLRY